MIPIRSQEIPTPSIRAQVITRRTYNRPKNEEGTEFETWEETVDRVIGHQRWLWERAASRQLLSAELDELEDLRWLLLPRKASLSGRTLWLGGTEIAKKVECSQFNCAASRSSTVHDMVDHFHLLLNGCGVGHIAVPGVLNGFSKPVSEIRTIRSERTVEMWNAGDLGRDENKESFYEEDDGKVVWRLEVGDSANGWAKSFGKILAVKRPVDVIELDYRQIRAPGIRLRGYGWISSGDGPISKAFNKICELLSKRSGLLLTRMDILDLENWIGTTLSSRRSAELSLCPFDAPEWEEFALSKLNHFEKGEPQRAQSNNSLIFNSKPSKAELYGIFSLIQLSGGSEPGFINGEEARRRAPWFASVNPCLVGDTLVYVADGRGSVPIKQLVDEDRDVPVFCYNSKGKVVVRTMRHPRLTGHNEKIYKVTLDDGSEIRTTGNHKFLLSSGEYRDVKTLEFNDSLNIIGQSVAKFDDINEKSNSTSKDYIWIEDNRGKFVPEHRLIAAFNSGSDDIQAGYVVHHEDRNPLNNASSNLVIMQKVEHDKLHGVDKMGDSNPMRRAQVEWSDERWEEHSKNLSEAVKEDLNGNYSGYTNEQLRGLAINLTQSVGRRFTTSEWVEMASKEGAPQSFSDWREAHLGGVYGLACWAANKCGYVNHTMHPHTYKLYDRMLDAGYQCEVEGDGSSFVIVKYCEHCGAEMRLNPSEREYGYCSRSCAAKHNPIRDNKNKDLSLAAESFNHRVISVEEDGFEDVYNGTVDEFHNFFVGGFESTNRFGKKKIVFLNNLQCGEALLGDKSFCNLVIVDAGKYNGKYEEFKRAIHIVARANYRQTCVDLRDGILQHSWDELNRFLRLCGVDITGIVRWEFQKDPQKWEDLKKCANDGAHSMADELGLPRSKLVTIGKPNGTQGKTMDTTEGCHMPPGKHIFNMVGFSKHDPMVQRLKNSNYRVIENPYDSTSALVTLPFCYEDVEFTKVETERGVAFINTESAVDQLERYRMLMEHYIDHNMSITVSYSTDEIPSIVDWINKYWNSYVGVSFLPRIDPLATPESVNYPYLPQQCVTEQEYNAYVATLLPVELDGANSFDEIQQEECAGGMCPVR